MVIMSPQLHLKYSTNNYDISHISSSLYQHSDVYKARLCIGKLQLISCGETERTFLLFLCGLMRNIQSNIHMLYKVAVPGDPINKNDHFLLYLLSILNMIFLLKLAPVPPIFNPSYPVVPGYESGGRLN